MGTANKRNLGKTNENRAKRSRQFMEVLESRTLLSTDLIGTMPEVGAHANLVSASQAESPRRYRLDGYAPNNSPATPPGGQGNAAQDFFDRYHEQYKPYFGPTPKPTPEPKPSPVPAVIPTPTPAPTPTPNKTVLQGPIHAFTWFPVAKSPANTYGMLWATPSRSPVTVAKESQALPAGTVALEMAYFTDGLVGNSLDMCRTANGKSTQYISPWLDHGIATVQARVTQWISAYQAAGGRMDYLVIDYEASLAMWNLSAAHIRAIQADPRGSALLASLGLSGVNGVINFTTSTDYLKWNAGMKDIVNQALNQSLFNVVQKYYPSARMSNYDSYAMTQQNVAPDPNGYLQWSNTFAGNVQAPSFYGYIGQLTRLTLGGSRQVYGNSPLAVLRLEVNTLRSMVRSSSSPIDAWIPYESYHEGALRNGPYYQEMLYHLALGGVQDFLYWNAGGTAADDAAVVQALATVNGLLGTGVRQTVTTAAMPWDSSLVVSGMQINNTQVLWRVTAPAGTKKIAVAGTGQVLTVPAGQVGVWYTSQVGVTPAFQVAG